MRSISIIVQCRKTAAVPTINTRHTAIPKIPFPLPLPRFPTLCPLSTEDRAFSRLKAWQVVRVAYTEITGTARPAPDGGLSHES